MSARHVRRSFAAPFVVTLAGAASVAGVACTKQTAPLAHHNPPGPSGSGHTDPPAPQTTDPAPDPVDMTKPVVVHRNPPPPNPADSKPPKQEPPKPEPAKYDQRWSVTKIKGQADCKAYVDVTCPKADPGKPMPTCNPPPPIAYTCPDGLQDGNTLKIVLRAGATECFVDYGPMKCPDGAKCNPPPPRKIACPQR